LGLILICKTLSKNVSAEMAFHKIDPLGTVCMRVVSLSKVEIFATESAANGTPVTVGLRVEALTLFAKGPVGPGVDFTILFWS
jgi:hypothetical protein